MSNCLNPKRSKREIVRFSSCRYQLRLSQISIVRTVTESMPFSSATFFSKEEVVLGAGASETAEETKTREGNTGARKNFE
jgi:hypothetical protein